MEQRPRRFVVAIGGNAIAASDMDEEAQRLSVKRAMTQVVRLLEDGHEVVLTHGNGPQVGHLLAQSEVTAGSTPSRSLDVFVAQTQASIGLMFAVALEEALSDAALTARPAALVTRVRVEDEDPAWERPTKPIGDVVDDEERRRLVAAGVHVTALSGGGWRRVVPSPEPREVVEIAAVSALLADGFIPIVAGGGGIPGVRVCGSWRGVEAVLDKDLTAALLAISLDADRLVIATDVSNVIVDYGSPGARPLARVTATEIRTFAARGHFPAGSMGPKVEAAARFVDATGEIAAIASLAEIYDAANGVAGTIVEPEDRAA